MPEVDSLRHVGGAKIVVATSVEVQRKEAPSQVRLGVGRIRADVAPHTSAPCLRGGASQPFRVMKEHHITGLDQREATPGRWRAGVSSYVACAASSSVMRLQECLSITWWILGDLEEWGRARDDEPAAIDPRPAGIGRQRGQHLAATTPGGRVHVPPHASSHLFARDAGNLCRSANLVLAENGRKRSNGSRPIWTSVTWGGMNSSSPKRRGCTTEIMVSRRAASGQWPFPHSPHAPAANVNLRRTTGTSGPVASYVVRVGSLRPRSAAPHRPR